MAARKDRTVKERTRERIKIAQLIDRVERFALGKTDKFGQEIKMSSAQLNGALALIRKVLPDLSASDIQVTDLGPQNKAEAKEKLVTTLGEDIARKIAPEFFSEDLSEDRTLN